MPEAHTFGESKADALDHAQDALLTALDGYISNKRPIPTPSRAGKLVVEVPPLDVAKLELYEGYCQLKQNRPDWTPTCPVHDPARAHHLGGLSVEFSLT